MNKFSALARDQYLGFLVRQNLLMLVAYALLAIVATVLAQPLVTLWTRRSKYRKPIAIALRSFAIVAVMHGYCTLRLMQTRPYFLNEAEFGQWYYKALDLLPDPVKPAGSFHPVHLAAGRFHQPLAGLAHPPPRPPGLGGGGHHHRVHRVRPRHPTLGPPPAARCDLDRQNA